MDLATIHALIQEFEDKFSGWEIHVPTEDNPPKPGDDLIDGLVYAIVREPSGAIYTLLAGLPTEDIEQTIYELVQEVIGTFYEDIENLTTLDIHLYVHITPISSRQSRLEIHYLRESLKDAYHVSATVTGSGFMLVPIVHIYMKERFLNESGLRKVEAELSTAIRNAINENPIFLHMVTRGKKIRSLRLSYSHSASQN